MSDKVLTISVAAYNVEKYLRTTLDSLLGAETVLERMEVLVIDDGSKDSTREIAQSYADRYPNSFFVIAKENGGWGSTVNAGIKNAHGKYFRLLDGDDWLKTENLAEFVSYLRSADADLVVAPYMRVYEKDGSEERMDRHTYLPADEMSAFSDVEPGKVPDIHHAELAVRTELLQKHQVTISEKAFYTDNEFVYFSVQYAATIARFPKSIYCYRIGVEGQSVSLSGRRRNWQSGEIVSRKMISAYKQHNDSLPVASRQMLYQMLTGITGYQIITYTLLDPSPETKRRLVEYDAWIRSEMPELYATLGASQRTIRWLRKSRFALYGIIHVYQMRKYRKIWG